MSNAICMPMCIKHDAIRPCPLCDKIRFCGCGNKLITDEELDLKVCRECK